jgi:hypothetical protein
MPHHPNPDPDHSRSVSSRAVTPSIPSSSQSSHADQPNPYPSVEDFINTLHTRYPHRNIDRFELCLTGADYYHVNDLAKLDQQFLESSEVGMTTGNASFFVDEVAKVMRRVGRELKDAKKAKKAQTAAIIANWS